MIDFDDLIGVDVDDLRQAVCRFGRGQITALEMSMPVKMVTRLCDAQEPVKRFQPLVGLLIIVVDSEWRRVCAENIEGAAIAHAVQHQLGNHTECS